MPARTPRVGRAIEYQIVPVELDHDRRRRERDEQYRQHHAGQNGAQPARREFRSVSRKSAAASVMTPRTEPKKLVDVAAKISAPATSSTPIVRKTSLKPLRKRKRSSSARAARSPGRRRSVRRCAHGLQLLGLGGIDDAGLDG